MGDCGEDVNANLVSHVTGDSQLDKAIWQWITWDKNPKTRAQIEELVKEGKKTELRERLCCRMTFGTSGLRAAMGAGFSLINDLTVIQSTQPYAVKQMKATAGVMITASHNPKQDNGYKVYWETGSQITSPHDKEILKCIEESVEPWDGTWNENIADGSPLRSDPLDEICKSYMEDLKVICFHRDLNAKTSLRFVHTAFHGVGHDYVQLAFKAFGFAPPIPVQEQKDPDPDFSTVRCPNPEEGESVLELALRLAEKEGARVVLATDPDADRLAVAEQYENGRWKVFTGNELAALLGWWLLACWKEKHPDAADIKRVHMLATTVSSKILQTIAQQEGFQFVETLPGFKWIGNRIKELMDNGNEVLFAFEESIGFMCGTSVLDKDGVSAAVVVAEMAAYLETRNLTLSQQLSKIYETYGFHISKTSYLICQHLPTIKRIFDRLRNFEGEREYPRSCGGYSIVHTRDVTTGYDSSQPGFMCGTSVLDKDGVSAAVVVAEMAAYLETRNLTLSQQLSKIYETYGFHISKTSYLICQHLPTIKRIFDRLRNFGGEREYPRSCGGYSIVHTRDVTTGYDSSQPGQKCVLPVTKNSQMVTFTFQNGCVATLRTSGTEPKIKYYAELRAAPGQSDPACLKEELQKLIHVLVEEFLEPDKNKLIRRSV
ncbi:UNVERIFIED_CONTAM: hypothetical protein FKN15_039839 [Acipenser sinensis]